MDNKNYKILELDKILALLSEFASCEDSKAAALDSIPKSNLAEAQALINQTMDAHMLMARFGSPGFGGMQNVNNSLKKAEAGSTLSMSELLSIAAVLKTIRALHEWRSGNSGVRSALDLFFGAIQPNKYLETKISTAIISDEEMSDSASPLLYDIRRKIKVQSSKVREQLDKMIHSSHYQKYLQEAIVTMRNGRFVVPVKNEFRGEIKGLVHDTSASGATVFIEPVGVVDANNEIRVLKGSERDEIERILYELSVEAGSFSDSIRSSYECAVELDLIFAKAKLAYKMNAAVPLLNNCGKIDIKKARHPLISPAKVVPTDIRLGDDFDTLMITGPNTGGKTVLIKTIGLFCLMAMCGLMIPAAENSRIAVFDSILADIGDEQSIEQSLSTFSSHMVNIVKIIEEAGDKSLVLIDELGAGTDPVEGAALAMAILERLHLNGAKVAATTHYAELKAYALQTPRIENACCEFDVATLKPTYKLLIGVMGSSNAFAISERLGLDKLLVDRARELVSAENIRFEDVVETLEQSKRAANVEQEEARRLRLSAEKERLDAQKRRENIDIQIEKELEKARGEALRITERAKRESYTLLEELKKIKKESESNKNADELLRRAKASIRRGLDSMEDTAHVSISFEDNEDYVLPRELKIGDTVMVKGLGNTAIITDLPDKNSSIEVVAGSIKTRIKLKDLRLVEAPNPKKNTPSTRNVKSLDSRANIRVETKCDLRGKTAEEAIQDLDLFIDSALRAGVNELSIVHGKGTGVLRAAVQQYLRGNKMIKSFRLGTFGEGENGVTIAELK